MVQGPNDLIPPPTNPPNQPQNTDAVRQKRQAAATPPVQPAPFQQAADTVQLSENAVQAAAYARAGGVQPAVNGQPIPAPPAPALRPAAGPQLNAAGPLAPPAGIAPATPPAPAVGAPTGAPGTLVQEKTPPVQALAAAFAATPARTEFQAEPEVRPDRVREALNALASSNEDPGAVNAQVAEKLLTEF